MMRSSITGILVCVSSLVAVACARVALTPVTDSSHRLEFATFSIQPPQGPNWYVAGRDPRGVAFVKRLVERPRGLIEQIHTFGVLAAVGDIRDNRGSLKIESAEDVIEQIRRTVTPSASSRFKLLKLITAPDASHQATCARYEASLEERANPRFPGVVFVLTVIGVRCLHPYTSTLLVDVNYSERYPVGEQSGLTDALREEVEPVLKSLAFSSPG